MAKSFYFAPDIPLPIPPVQRANNSAQSTLFSNVVLQPIEKFSYFIFVIKLEAVHSIFLICRILSEF